MKQSFCVERWLNFFTFVKIPKRKIGHAYKVYMIVPWHHTMSFVSQSSNRVETWGYLPI